ncbi:MAG: sortase [Chloroflexota bacterium]
MRDKRPVDELSVAELERVLAIKRREERQQSIDRMQKSGRRVDMPETEIYDAPNDPPHAHEALLPAPTHDPVAAALAALTQPAIQEAPRSTSYEPGASHSAVPYFDESASAVPPATQKANKRARRKLFDRLLLLVEVAAVIGIAAIGINLLQAIGKLDAETATAQQLADEQRRLTIPTVAPTPTIRLENVVLPGGHVYEPNSAPQFNYNEIPSSLYARVQSEWIQPVINRPPQTSETALALIVPKLNLNGTIVQGVDWDALKQGVGQVPNGVNPGDDVGNVSFAAHDDIYGELFRYLDQLEPGDTFQVQTRTAVYTYSVRETRIVEPNDVGVLENRQGATATLISCYPYQVNTQRIVVFADRIS